MEPFTQYEREEWIALMQYALRDEIDIDKQIEDWTWKRFKQTDKAIESWTWERFKRTDKKIEDWTWKRFKQTDKAIESWTWERFKRIRQLFEADQLARAAYWNRIPYQEGEKIRLVILFLIPSAWASLESFYYAVKEDPRYEVTMLLYDGIQREKSPQVRGGKEFLDSHGIPYEDAATYDFRMNRPHIIMYQSPWEDSQLPRFLHSDEIAALGIRIAYIPYGINYSASVNLAYVFSDLHFKSKPWFIAGISPGLKRDHQNLSSRCGHNIIVTGSPKFDFLFNNQTEELDKELLEKVGSRKIVFIQMHFPDKVPRICVPFIKEYTDFLKKVNRYEELFFIVRPHPRCLYDYRNRFDCGEEVDEFLRVIESNENVMLDEYQDYRIALKNASYVIGDRSALMVEAGALNVPVLFLTNYFYKEEMLPYIQPLFDSYYHGTSAYDMERFIDFVVRHGNDYKKEEREHAIQECIPYRDGKCGKRIADVMVELIRKESIH